MIRRYIFTTILAVFLSVTTAFPAADKADELVDLVIKGSTSDAERAQKLLEAAGTVSDDPAMRKVFLLKALEYAEKDPGDMDTARRIIAELVALEILSRDEAFERGLAMMEKKYSITAGPERTELAGQLLELHLRAGDSNLEKGRATKALEQFQKARQFATVLKKPETVAEINEKIKQASAAQQVELKKIELEKKLKADPGDKTARRRLVLMHVIQFNDPEAAAKLLTNDLEDELRVAVQMAAGPKDQLRPEDSVELAKWYKKLGDGGARDTRIKTLLRAREYYQLAVDSEKLSGVAALKTRMAIKKIDEDLRSLGYAAPGELPPGRWTDLTRYVTPDLPHINGRIEKKGVAVILHPAPGEYPRGYAPIPVEIKGSYEYQVQVQWQDNWRGCSFHLPVGPDYTISFDFNTYRSAFTRIDGMGAWQENYPAVVRMPRNMRSGVPYTIAISVKIKDETVTLMAGLNRVALLKWEGKIGRLRRRRDSRGPNILGIGTSRQPTAFTGFKVKLLDGEGRIIDMKK